MADLYVFDKDDKLLSILSSDAGGACLFFEAPFEEELNREPTFQFKAAADHPDASYLIDENQVGFFDKDDIFRLFIIRNPEWMNGKDGPIISAECVSWMQELEDEPLEDTRAYNVTAEEATIRALSKTRIKVGIVAELGINSANFYYISAKSALEVIINTWGGELRERVEFDDTGITDRYIDILPRRGQDTGHRWYIDEDIESLNYRIESSPKTALYGRGSSLQTDDGGFTRKITFADVEWKVSKGDPVDKPLGQEWVGDPRALQKYGRKNKADGTRRHRFGFFEDGEQEDPATLLEETYDALQSEMEPLLNASMSVHLLENISGYEHRKARLGDTTIAIDDSFARSIELESRIIKFKYDVANPDETAQVELGSFIEFDDLEDRIGSIEAKLNEKSGVWSNPPSLEIDPKKYPDIKPSTPVITAEANFASVNLNWEYAYEEFYTQAFEVFVSEIPAFTVTDENLIYRGIANGYNFIGEANRQYYFRVRAVNYHGRYSDLSDEVSATTARIISDDILFGPEIAEELRELSKTADILAPGSVDLEKMKQEALDKINESSREYSQEEIQKVADEINQELADKAGLDYVDGKLRLKVDTGTYTNKMGQIDASVSGLRVNYSSVQSEVDGVNTRLITTQSQIDAQDTMIRAKAEGSEVTAVNDRVSTVNSKVSTLEVSVKGISTNVTSIKTELDDTKYNSGLNGDDSISGTISSSKKGTWVRIAMNLGNRAWARFIVRDTTSSQHGVIQFTAGAHYNNRGGLEFTLLSFSRYTSFPFTKARILTKETYDEQYLDLYFNPTRDTTNSIQFWIKENIQSEGWKALKFADATVPTGYSSTEFNISQNDAVSGRISKAETRIDQTETEIGLKASLQSVNNLTGRMDKAESSLTVQSKQIEAKVDSNGVIAAINLQPGTAKINAALIDLVGDVYINNGRTLISTAAIKTAAIADGAITRAKLGTAIIGDAQIENGVITNAKIKDVSADKIKFGTATGIALTAVTINGSQFRSSDGTTSLDITGGHVRLRQSNGNYVHTNPDGLYGYNSNGSLRFQADSLLVTSRALGTTTANVYIAAQSGKEARAVDMKDVPSDGEISSYTYIPVRAQGFYGNYIEVNAGENGFNLYLRPRNGGEVRITGANTTTVYYPLRASTFYGTSFITTTASAWIGTDVMLHVVAKGTAEGSLNPIYRDLRAASIYGGSFITSTYHAYIGTDDELRVQNKSLDGIWRNVRANVYYGNAVDINTGTHLYIRPSSSGEVRITQTGTTGTYKNFRAQNIYAQGSVSETSLAERKQDIEEMQESALDLVMNSTIYQYRLKEDVKTGQGKMKYGFVIGEGYKTPTQVLAPDLASISLYSQGSINWKATKELGLKQYQHELKLNDLSLKAQYQDLIIEKQGEQISKMQDEIKYLKDAVA
ncbi:hypothetical protein Q0N12_04185 [Rossellomorea marisflavi]|uniref:phage tail protein n=1 Tax=Rossellomorea marisflavi TaxID=189381 RepID=UPI00345B42B8